MLGDTETFSLAWVAHGGVKLFVANVANGTLLRCVSTLAPCTSWGGVFSCSDIFLYTL